mmetsp:Transcript_91760/g.237790  ORF Transcript_91760/g.237790 Transcript_91760/m.237790 type:complete len:214 (-) Transcript_91760:874-1515(-)
MLRREVWRIPRDGVWGFLVPVEVDMRRVVLEHAVEAELVPELWIVGDLVWRAAGLEKMICRLRSTQHLCKWLRLEALWQALEFHSSLELADERHPEHLCGKPRLPAAHFVKLGKLELEALLRPFLDVALAPWVAVHPISEVIDVVLLKVHMLEELCANLHDGVGGHVMALHVDVPQPPRLLFVLQPHSDRISLAAAEARLGARLCGTIQPSPT